MGQRRHAAVNLQAAQRNDINVLGSFAGAMAQTPADASVDEMPAGDLEITRLFGRRGGQVAARFKG